MRYCDQCHTEILDWDRSVTNDDGVFCTRICAQIQRTKLEKSRAEEQPQKEIPVKRTIPKLQFPLELKGFLEGVAAMGVILLILKIVEALKK